MKILITHEWSGEVREAFSRRGHLVLSCDILDTAIKGAHYKGRVEDIINSDWDMIISFPPCDYVCSSGLHWNKRTAGRSAKTDAALQHVATLLNNPCKRKALENPIGCISTRIKKNLSGVWEVLQEPETGANPPTQIIQPWQFGHPESKATCLWLQGLPVLTPTAQAAFTHYRCRCGNVFPADAGKYGCCEVAAKPKWDNQTKSGQSNLPPSADRKKLRGKTYRGIADAMASQWG